MDMKILIYVVVIFIIGILAWSITTIANGANKPDPQYQYYNRLQQQSADGCGDLTDNGNVQHLSHHPEQYLECIKKVDTQKFKEVVGQDRNDFLRSKGL